jgi:hypothetical protein
MPFKKTGKPDLHHVLILGTGPLFRMGNFVSKWGYLRPATNYGKSLIHQIQILFEAFNIVPTTNNPFPAMTFIHVLLSLVQPDNIHATIFIETCMSLRKIGQVSKIPQPHLLNSRG